MLWAQARVISDRVIYRRDVPVAGKPPKHEAGTPFPGHPLRCRRRVPSLTADAPDATDLFASGHRRRVGRPYRHLVHHATS